MHIGQKMAREKEEVITVCWQDAVDMKMEEEEVPNDTSVDPESPPMARLEEGVSVEGDEKNPEIEWN